MLAHRGRTYFEANVHVWRAALIEELTSNRSGFLKNRERAVAAKVPLDFPKLDVVLRYTSPVSSVVESQTYVYEHRPIKIHVLLKDSQIWFGFRSYSTMYKRCLPIAHAYYIQHVSTTPSRKSCATLTNKQLFATSAPRQLPPSQRILAIKKDNGVFIAKVEAPVSAYAGSVDQLTKNSREQASRPIPLEEFDVPLVIAQVYLSDLVQQFLTTSKGKRFLAAHPGQLSVVEVCLPFNATTIYSSYHPVLVIHPSTAALAEGLERG